MSAPASDVIAPPLKSATTSRLLKLSKAHRLPVTLRLHRRLLCRQTFADFRPRCTHPGEKSGLCPFGVGIAALAADLPMHSSGSSSLPVCRYHLLPADSGRDEHAAPSSTAGETCARLLSTYNVDGRSTAKAKRAVLPSPAAVVTFTCAVTLVSSAPWMSTFPTLNPIPASSTSESWQWWAAGL